jgi:hypothetical protein
MSMRMIPIRQLFQKMTRLVRDLSRKTGKTVELELAGEETELDRNIVEELADPLMHMVRNAIDHGVEPPEDRVRAGKPPAARVLLKAGHQAGHILLQVSDDGRGLDAQSILLKARQRGLVEEGAQLSENEIFQLIYTQQRLLRQGDLQLLLREGPQHSYSWGFYGAEGNRIVRYGGCLVLTWRNTSLEAGYRQQFGLQDGIRNNRYWSFLLTRQTTKPFHSSSQAE